MSFLKPMMLLGVLGALVPIIIHLIHKRRPRKQEFGAIEFVLRSVQRVQRRWRLKRFLLLASRILIITCLAVAAARPLLGSNSASLVESSGPLRLVLVIDGSLSMRARFEKGPTGFQQAVSKARTIIEGLGPEDQMTIVVAHPEPRVLFETLSSSKPDLLRALQSARVGYAHVDISNAVTVAGQLLTAKDGTPGNQPKESKASKPSLDQIVILSDLAAHGFVQSAHVQNAIKISAIDVFEGLAAKELRYDRT